MVALDLTKTNKLSVPLILFEGRHDRLVNSAVAASWFDTVKAPDKHLVWFEHSGHIPMTEERGKFLLSLVRYARSICLWRRRAISALSTPPGSRWHPLARAANKFNNSAPLLINECFDPYAGKRWD